MVFLVSGAAELDIRFSLLSSFRHDEHNWRTVKDLRGLEQDGAGGWRYCAGGLRRGRAVTVTGGAGAAAAAAVRVGAAAVICPSAVVTERRSRVINP